MAILITSTHKFKYGGSKNNIYGRLKEMVFNNTIGEERVTLTFEYFFNEQARITGATPIIPEQRDGLYACRSFTIPKAELFNMASFDPLLSNSLEQLGARIYQIWQEKIDAFNQDVEDGHWVYDAGTPNQFTPNKITYQAAL